MGTVVNLWPEGLSSSHCEVNIIQDICCCDADGRFNHIMDRNQALTITVMNQSLVDYQIYWFNGRQNQFVTQIYADFII